MKINMRLKGISTYDFKELNKQKERLLENNIKVTDLSIGDPGEKPHNDITTALIEAIGKDHFNNYPPYEGIKLLKEAIVDFYRTHYEVMLEEDEVLITIGAKDAINTIISAVCNVGDWAIIPQPAYPTYENCCRIWGVNPYKIPLSIKNEYLPILSHIPDRITSTAKLFMVNYPNNPTGAIANEEFYEYIREYCSRNNIILVNDGTYNDIVLPGIKPLSVLKGDSKRTAVEIGSFSKSFNMTGFRVGYIVGNREIIREVARLKSNIDSGQFLPLQYSACEALKLKESYYIQLKEMYFRRRSAAEACLSAAGIDFYKGSGTFYIWCAVPKGYSTHEYCHSLLDKYHLLVTPGNVFGSLGDGHFRISLTSEKAEICETLSKIKKI